MKWWLGFGAIYLVVFWSLIALATGRLVFGPMTFAITFGWWLVPALVTVAAFGAAYLAMPSRRPPSGYGDIGGAIVALVEFAAAAILSLIAWLAWAVLA